MRFLPQVLVAAAIGLVAACASTDVGPPPPAPVDPSVFRPTTLHTSAAPPTLQATERNALEAFGHAMTQPDLSGLAPLLDPDADFAYPGMSDAPDRDGLLKAMTALFGAFSNRTYAESRIWLIGEAAVVEWTLRGTQSGEWMGVNPTSRPVTIAGLTLCWFNLNGLINEVHVYFDAGSVLTQLGAAPKGLPPPLQPPASPASPEVVIAEGKHEEAENVAALRSSFDALEGKNEAAFVAPMADDVELIRLDRASPERGKEAQRAYFRWITHGIHSLAQTPRSSWGAGNFAIEEYSLSGVNSGKLVNAPSSGHALRLHFVDICELSAGKIMRIWRYGNSLEPLAQVGAIDRASPGSSSAFVH